MKLEKYFVSHYPSSSCITSRYSTTAPRFPEIPRDNFADMPRIVENACRCDSTRVVAFLFLLGLGWGAARETGPPFLSNRNLFRQLLRRIRPNLRQRRMVVWHRREFMDRHPIVHRRDDLMDQFSTYRSNATAA